MEAVVGEPRPRRTRHKSERRRLEKVVRNLQLHHQPLTVIIIIPIRIALCDGM